MTKRRTSVKTTALLFAVGIFLAFPWLNGYSFLQYMKIKHHIDVHGFWYPSYLPLGKFYVRNLRASWKDDFQILSGKLEVQYDPFLFSVSRGGVLLEGRDLEVTVKKINPNVKIKGPFTVDRVDIALELRPNAEPLIQKFEIDSPVIQFKITGNTHG